MSFGRLGALGRGFGRLGTSLGGAGNSQPVIPGVLTAGVGSYSFSGDTMTPVVDHKFVVDAGSYLFTGQSANLITFKLIAASAGSYDFTGQSVTLTKASGVSARQFSDINTYLNAGTTRRSFSSFDHYVVA